MYGTGYCMTRQLYAWHRSMHDKASGAAAWQRHARSSLGRVSAGSRSTTSRQCGRGGRCCASRWPRCGFLECCPGTAAMTRSRNSSLSAALPAAPASLLGPALLSGPGRRVSDPSCSCSKLPGWSAAVCAGAAAACEAEDPGRHSSIASYGLLYAMSCKELSLESAGIPPAQKKAAMLDTLQTPEHGGWGRAAYQRRHKLHVIGDLEPVPGSHMAQAPGGQQLCIHKAPVALPVGHPQRQQAPPLDGHA